MINLGSTEAKDFALGSTLLDKMTLGSAVVHDPYSDVSGTLPLTYTSRAEHTLKNYSVYGTSSGSGAATNNIFNKDAKDTTNGFVANARLRTDGVVQSYTGSNITEYIPITPGRNYYIWPGATLNLFGDEIYDANKVRTRGAEYQSREYLGFTAREGEAYVRFTYWAANDCKVALYKGSNSQTFIPYGYQLSLTNTDGTNSQTYPLYIGDSKLGEEEYVDYGEQKVYKRTENLFDYQTMMGVAGKYINGSGTEYTSSEWSITDYIPVDGSTFTVGKLGGNSQGICLYDENKFFITGASYNSGGSSTFIDTTVTGNGAKFIRFSYYSGSGTSHIDLSTVYLVSGSTAPAQYIPYLQPTDPPASLPAITAYAGENTLSSTETVGEVTLTGRIAEST